MTLPEQAGKVITTTVDAMRGSPGLLSVLLLQLITLGVLYFIQAANAEHRQQREMYLLQHCLDGKEPPP